MSDGSLLDDAKLSRKVGVRFVSLIVPVAATMLSVVWSVTCLSPINVNNKEPPLSFIVNEDDANGAGERAAFSILAAVIVVALVMLLTYFIIFLYHSHLQFVLYGWLGFSAASMFFVLLWVWLDLFCTCFQLPYNVLSMAAFVWNFGVVGLISLFYYAHPAVTQVYLVLASILIAWSMTGLPEWTTWALLVCIAGYDILAVMWPQGPLHRLIRVAQERNEPIPGFVYDSAHGVAPLARPTGTAGAAVPATHTAPASSNPAAASADAAPPPTTSPARAARVAAAPVAVPVEYVLQHAAPFKLGLGDFIFYSLLVGRASLSGFVPWTFCCVSVLAGMVGTLLLLLLCRGVLHALPALPCSIFLSIAVFIFCILLVQPLSNFASQQLLVL